MNAVGGKGTKKKGKSRKRKWNAKKLNLPEKRLARAAIVKEKITAGPAMLRATIPATFEGET